MEMEGSLLPSIMIMATTQGTDAMAVSIKIKDIVPVRRIRETRGRCPPASYKNNKDMKTT